MTFIVRVSKSDVVFLSLCRICLDGRILFFFLSLGSILSQKRVDYNLSDQQDMSIE